LNLTELLRGSCTHRLGIRDSWNGSCNDPK
jgi:hypothetical protein